MSCVDSFESFFTRSCMSWICYIRGRGKKQSFDDAIVRCPNVIRRKLIYNQIFKLGIALCPVWTHLVLFYALVYELDLLYSGAGKKAKF